MSKDQQFKLSDPYHSYSSVSLAGDFNGWDTVANPMSYNKDTGYWNLTLSIFHDSEKIYYKFVTDGSNWICNKDELIETDETGNQNNYLIINENDANEPKISEQIREEEVSGSLGSQEAAASDGSTLTPVVSQKKNVTSIPTGKGAWYNLFKVWNSINLLFKYYILLKLFGIKIKMPYSSPPTSTTSQSNGDAATEIDD